MEKNENMSSVPAETGVDKSGNRIQQMFADIAPRYDFLNHLLSANQDKVWRRKAINWCQIQADSKVLDVCCGTGDLAFEAAKRLDKQTSAEVQATDFCEEMVVLAQTKAENRPETEVPVHFQVADTQILPFEDSRFDLVTVGFGIRNVESLKKGIQEMMRVARPGGQVLILEFTQPKWKWFRKLFGFYFHRILPKIGRLLSPKKANERDDAYQYLPESVGEFPDAPTLAQKMEDFGLEQVQYKSLMLGIACVHMGIKPNES